MNYKNILISFLLGGLLLAPNLGLAQADVNSPEIKVLNEKIASSKEKIKQLEETIVKYNKNINQKQTEAVSLKNQLSILDSRLEQAKTDIDLTNEKIKQTGNEIDALGISIQDKQILIDRQKAMLVKMVQDIHVNDQKNYIEIALTNSNFAEFYDQVSYVRNLYIDIGRLAKENRIAKEQLDAKKKQTEIKKQIYVDLQAELADKHKELGNQSDYKQKLLTDTKNSEAKFRTLLSSLKQQYQVIVTEQQTFEAQVRKKLEAQDKIQRTGDVAMTWPVPSRYINATFHDPGYPFRSVFQHSGIDIKASQGTPIRAAASGYVARARRCSVASCYSYVLLVHTGAISSLYGHMSSILVADDAFVNAGDIIGYSGGRPGSVGSGPFVTGPHLHFEVRLNGIPTDPMPYLIQ